MTNRSTETIEIKPVTPLFDFRLKELLHYRYLLFLFIRRDFITNYKQTILGPVWHIVQPLFTTLVFTLVFGVFARIKTDGVPPILFYLSGVTLWSYLAACVNKTSGTFVSNAAIFGKVYFPRITVPIASVISSLLGLGIQLGVLAVLMFVYRDRITFHWYSLVLTPVFILLLAFIGLGIGIIVSSLTIKYRDLAYLMTFGIQLWMYATPVVYPLSLPSISGKFRLMLKLNPITSIVEGFRHSLFGVGIFLWHDFFYTVCFALAVFLIGILLFNKTQSNFMDTV